MKTCLFYILLFFTVSGCSKSSSTDKDTEVPVITIDRPHDNQQFDDGDTVTVSGSITDNKYIAEVHIVVTDLNTGTVYVHAHLYPATTYATFSQDFTAIAGVDYKVELIVLDRSTNTADASVQIFVN